MSTQTTEQLASKVCPPCEGKVAKYTPSEAEAQLKPLCGWRLFDEGRRIRKDWKMKNFGAGMAFFNNVSVLAEQEGHHPDLHLEDYRNVRIEIWTHAIDGLSESDFILAAKIDRLPVKVR